MENTDILEIITVSVPEYFRSKSRHREPKKTLKDYTKVLKNIIKPDLSRQQAK